MKKEKQKSMKQNTSLIIIFFLSMIIMTQTSANENEKEQQLTLNDSNKEPFTTKNNDGFLDIILSDAFQRAGYKLNTVQLPPERGLLSANDGIIDGDVNRIIGLDKTYTNLVRVPEKIRDSEFCALAKDDSIINTPDELKKHIVGHVKGWKIYDKMMSKSKNVITASSPQQLFRLLKINRIDVALYSCAEGIEQAKQIGLTGMKILKPAFTQTELYLYLNKRYADLVPKLSEALRQIKKEGLYDRLYQEKIQPYYTDLK